MTTVRDPLRSLTWRGITPLGHAKALGMLASGPMAILAGFVLASAIVLGLETSPELADYGALLLFCISSAVLLWGLHATAEAEGIHASPNDYLEWYPELHDRDWPARDEMRRRQREEFAAYYFYRRRGLNMYHVGTSLAIIGLAFFLLARIDGANFDPSLSEDTFAEVGLGIGATALGFLAGAILSYSPTVHGWRNPWKRVDGAGKVSRDVAEWRYDAAVLKGSRRLVKLDVSDEEKIRIMTEVDTIAADRISSL